MADLITLEDYKLYKGMAKTDQDDKIKFLISSVSALIKAYVGHGIIDNFDEPLEETITIPYDTTTLYLNAYPVTNIISVEEIYGGYIGGLDSTISYPRIFNTDYAFEANAGVLTRIGSNWSNTVKVTYNAGYEETPMEIKLAAIELVSYYLNEEWKPTRTTQGTTMVGPAPEAGGIPKHVAVMLDNYKVGM